MHGHIEGGWLAKMYIFQKYQKSHFQWKYPINTFLKSRGLKRGGILPCPGWDQFPLLIGARFSCKLCAYPLFFIAWIISHLFMNRHSYSQLDQFHYTTMNNEIKNTKQLDKHIIQKWIKNMYKMKGNIEIGLIITCAYCRRWTLLLYLFW